MKNNTFFVAVTVIGCLGFFFVKSGRTPSSITKKLPSAIQSQIEPTPIPFAELTIPFLRNRNYKSSLHELVKTHETATHTTYLTSYDSDNLKVNALLTQPKDTMPKDGWPAIIFIHGYIPPNTYKTESNYAAYVNALARHGFVVFKIDLRGHGSSEGEPGGAYYSSDYVIDTLNARAALQNTNFVNPDKIALWGHSMAGNVVMRSIAVKPDIPAAVIWAGAVYTYEDMVKYGLNDNSYRPPTLVTQRQRNRQKIRDLYGEFDPSKEFWQKVAVTQYIPEIKTAIQLHHAVDDAVVNIGYSRDILKLLKAQSVESELFEYSTGGHNIVGGNFNLAMQRTIDFYKEKIK